MTKKCSVRKELMREAFDFSHVFLIYPFLPFQLIKNTKKSKKFEIIFQKTEEEDGNKHNDKQRDKCETEKKIPCVCIIDSAKTQ